MPTHRIRFVPLMRLLTASLFLASLSLIPASTTLAAPAKSSGPKPVSKPVSPSVTKPALPAAPALVPRRVYESQCSYCHEPKPASALPDLKAWVRLLYTSGCPEVSVRLDEPQRRALKTLMEAEFKPKP